MTISAHIPILTDGEKTTMLAEPAILDHSANRNFRDQAAAMGLDPDDRWVGGYVREEWNGVRHLLEGYFENIEGKKILEFGCNYGGSSIIAAHMGASVTGVDIDPDNIALARHNAAQYDLAIQPEFLHVPDTRQLPFGDDGFDIIICNSVLEYVDPAMLDAVLSEIKRCLTPGGHLVITGTASRIAAKEVHSGRWLMNYWPSWFDTKILGLKDPLQRGLKPWKLFAAFPDWQNVDVEDGGRKWLEMRRKMGQSNTKLAILALANRICALIGMSIGQFGQSISVIYRRKI